MSRRNNEGGLMAIVRACSYFALAISALTFLFSGMNWWFGWHIMARAMNIVDVVGKACLLIGVAIPAYEFTLDKHIAWHIVFWVALVIFAAGCVFGVLPQI